MNKLSNELSIVPMPAWIVAGCLWLALAGLLSVVTRGDPALPPLGAVALLTFAPLALSLYVLLVGYVHADAKRRGMRHVMWTLLVIFIPNAIGFILYFLMREPIVTPCQSCGTSVKGAFPFCPKCGAVLHPSCPQCKKAVELVWVACAWCGQKLG